MEEKVKELEKKKVEKLESKYEEQLEEQKQEYEERISELEEKLSKKGVIEREDTEKHGTSGNNNISRRKFLKGLGVAGLGALAMTSPVASKISITSDTIKKDGTDILDGSLSDTDYLDLQGSNAMTGNLDLGSNNVENVAELVADSLKANSELELPTQESSDDNRIWVDETNSLLKVKIQGSVRTLEPKTAIPDSGIARYEYEQDVTDSWGDFDATDNSSAGYVPGQIGSYSKAFDGVDDSVDFPALPVSGSGPFSVALWVNYQTINTGNNQTALWWRDNEDVILREDGSGNFTLSGTDASYTITSNEWYLFALTCDPSGNRTAYQGDANQIGSGNATGSFGQQNTFGDAYNGSQPAEVYIDDPKFFDKELSASEVSSLYNTGSI